MRTGILLTVALILGAASWAGEAGGEERPEVTKVTVTAPGPPADLEALTQRRTSADVSAEKAAPPEAQAFPWKAVATAPVALVGFTLGTALDLSKGALDIGLQGLSTGAGTLLGAGEMAGNGLLRTGELFERGTRKVDARVEKIVDPQGGG